MQYREIFIIVPLFKMFDRNKTPPSIQIKKQCVIPLTLPFPELQEGFTDTTTPWHSDEAYWLDLADKRALSFWFPMQDVNVSKGVLAINTDTDMIDI